MLYKEIRVEIRKIIGNIYYCIVIVIICCSMVYSHNDDIKGYVFSGMFDTPKLPGKERGTTMGENVKTHHPRGTLYPDKYKISGMFDNTKTIGDTVINPWLCPTTQTQTEIPTQTPEIVRVQSQTEAPVQLQTEAPVQMQIDTPVQVQVDTQTQTTPKDLDSDSDAISTFRFNLNISMIYRMPILQHTTRRSLPLELARIRGRVESNCGTYMFPDRRLNELGQLQESVTFTCNNRQTNLRINVIFTVTLTNDLLRIFDVDITQGSMSNSFVNVEQYINMDQSISHYDINYIRSILSTDNVVNIPCVFAVDSGNSNIIVVNTPTPIPNIAPVLAYTILLKTISFTRQATNTLYDHGVLLVSILSTTNEANLINYQPRFNVMRISSNLAVIPAVLLHELGHHVMFRGYHLNPNHVTIHQVNTNHRPCIETDEYTAWYEGFASGYATIVGEVLGFLEIGKLDLIAWAPTPPGTLSYSFNVEKYGCASINIARDEGRIAALIYDLWDIPSDRTGDAVSANLIHTLGNMYPGLNYMWFGRIDRSDDNGLCTVSMRNLFVSALIQSTTDTLDAYVAALTGNIASPTDCTLVAAANSMRYNYYNGHIAGAIPGVTF